MLLDSHKNTLESEKALDWKRMGSLGSNFFFIWLWRALYFIEIPAFFSWRNILLLTHAASLEQIDAIYLWLFIKCLLREFKFFIIWRIFDVFKAISYKFKSRRFLAWEATKLQKKTCVSFIRKYFCKCIKWEMRCISLNFSFSSNWIHLDFHQVINNRISWYLSHLVRFVALFSTTWLLVSAWVTSSWKLKKTSLFWRIVWSMPKSDQIQSPKKLHTKVHFLTRRNCKVQICSKSWKKRCAKKLHMILRKISWQWRHKWKQNICHLHDRSIRFFFKDFFKWVPVCTLITLIDNMWNLL